MRRQERGTPFLPLQFFTIESAQAGSTEPVRGIHQIREEQQMKKLFTIDTFAVAFVSALGYGFGDVFSRLLGWPEFLCVLASIVLGIGMETIINKIAFRKEVQNNPKLRAILYGGIVLCFLFIHYMTVTRMGVSMMDYLLEQFT